MNIKKNNNLIKRIKNKAFAIPCKPSEQYKPWSFQKNQIFLNNQDRPQNVNKWFKFFLFKKPINLLFSIDQFLFEFSKKKPQKRKSSAFLQQLKQRKKLCFFYGDLSKNKINHLLKKAHTFPGCFSKNFLFLLERRLDVVLYRSRLATSISSARQLITHKKVSVNKTLVNIPSYSVKNGDIISIQGSSFRPISQELLARKKRHLRKSSTTVKAISNEKKFSYKKSNFLQNNSTKFSFYLNLIEFLCKKTEIRAQDQKNLALLKDNPLKKGRFFFFHYNLNQNLKIE